MNDKYVIAITFMLMILISVMMVLEVMISRRISEAEKRLEHKIDGLFIYPEASASDATETDATVSDATQMDAEVIMSVGNAFDTPTDAHIEPVNDVVEEIATEATKTDSEASEGCYIGTYELTAYIATGNPCADGRYPQTGYTVACNDSRLWHHTIMIDGYGQYYVHDTGGMASNVIDVFVGSYSEAIQFGRRKAEVYIID
jgi:3D (Asp-Asp-Asp) domain-containing protein